MNLSERFPSCRRVKKAILLKGLPEMRLHNVTINNISITSQQGVSVAHAEGILFDNVLVENQQGKSLNAFRVKNSKLELLKS